MTIMTGYDDCTITMVIKLLRKIANSPDVSKQTWPRALDSSFQENILIIVFPSFPAQKKKS